MRRETRLRAVEVGASDRFRLEVPSDPGYVAAARLFAASVARSCGCAEQDVDDVKLALSEACSNVLAARRDAGSDAPIRLRITLDRSNLVIEIEDAGLPFAPVPNDKEAGSSTDVLALVLGAELIRSLFPDARAHSNERGGFDLSFSVSTGGRVSQE